MQRVNLINTLISANGYTSYLEITFEKADMLFKQIEAEKKEVINPAVDKSEKENFENIIFYDTVSDVAFQQMPCEKKYDIIFIDGEHHSEVVAKEITNSLKHLNKGGIILIHDTAPMTNFSELAEDERNLSNGTWWGTVYKVIMQLDKVVPKFYTIDRTADEEGITGIGYFEGCENITFELDDISFDEYVQNRTKKMRIIDVDSFMSFFCNKPIKLFSLCHKPFENSDDVMSFTPLQLGNYCETFCTFNEKHNINILYLNEYLGEVSGIYWIWQNQCETTKFIGQTTYRRPFMIAKNFDILKYAFGYCYDIILPNEAILDTTVKENYGIWHNIEDLNILISIIEEYYPEYKNAMNKVLESNKLYVGNGFIMKSKDYNNYCSFLFDIINKIFQKLNLKNKQDVDAYIKKCALEGKYKNFSVEEYESAFLYEKRFIGFLSERILTIYVKKNFTNIYYIPYFKFPY